MKTLYRVAHALLVLALSALLVRTVWYAFALLWADQHPQHASETIVDSNPRKPSPQEIVGT
jgi:hypothetical protein